MAEWDLEMARNALDGLQLVDSNREVANYWLSLWSADNPPTRDRFEPRQLSKHLPAIAIFEVMPDGPVMCRLAGSYVESALGYDLTGRDLLEVTSVEEREARISFTRTIANGAIAYAGRHFRELDGSERVAAEISLPFAGANKNGGRQVLFHTAWRPRFPGRSKLETAPTDASLAEDQKILPIVRHE